MALTGVTPVSLQTAPMAKSAKRYVQEAVISGDWLALILKSAAGSKRRRSSLESVI
jgi:hypothetical protein